jgi:hypothetical protein
LSADPLGGGMTRAARIACLTLFLACWSPASSAPHAPGGPYYFDRFIHPFPSFYPTLPKGEISEGEAKSRTFWVEAYFNDAGQITRMVKFLDGKPAFDLRYTYGPSGQYEREEFVPLSSEVPPE